MMGKRRGGRKRGKQEGGCVRFLSRQLSNHYKPQLSRNERFKLHRADLTVHSFPHRTDRTKRQEDKNELDNGE